MPAPQGKRTEGTHAQVTSTNSTDQSELSIEAAESSAQHDKRTAGTDESPADVQLVEICTYRKPILVPLTVEGEIHDNVGITVNLL